jgi:hypothetical protein
MSVNPNKDLKNAARTAKKPENRPFLQANQAASQ